MDEGRGAARAHRIIPKWETEDSIPTSMADLWRDFPSGPNPPEEVNVVIELTRGSRNKYEYDASHGVFRLNRVLYT